MSSHTITGSPPTTTSSLPTRAERVRHGGSQLQALPRRRSSLAAIALALILMALPLVVSTGPAEAAFPGENGLIAFEFQGDIWTMKPDLSEAEVQVTETSDDDRRPTWSPDGRRIAFDSDRGGERNIWIMNADGSNLQQITDDPSDDLNAAWSPDGTRIAFERRRDGVPAVGLIEANPGDRPAFIESSAQQPAWSPDGSQIAFARYHDVNGTTGDIWSIDASGAVEPVQLTDEWFGPAHNRDTAPAWSPDGEQIAFQRVDADDPHGASELTAIHEADASPAEPLATNYDISGRAPAWSPEGGHVTYHEAGEDGIPHIFVTNLGSQEEMNLGAGRDPDWGTPPPPPAPIAVADTYVGVARDSVFQPAGSLLDNDEHDGTMHARVRSEPNHGELSAFFDGTFTYELDDPSTERTGDSFTYVACDSATISCSEPVTVSLIFEQPTSDPVAQDLVFEDVPRLFAFDASTLPGGDSELYSEQVTGATHGPFYGQVTHERSGDFTYALTSPFQPVTSDEFSYMLCDGDDVCSEPATVTLEFARDPIDVHLEDDMVTCDPGVECTVEVLGNDTVTWNDTVFDELELTDVQALGDTGGVYGYSNDGVFTFTPDADRTGGSETFSYSASVAMSELVLDLPEEGTIIARVRHATEVAVTASPESPTEGDEVTLTATVESLSDPPPVAVGGSSGSGDEDDSPSVEQGDIDPDDLSDPRAPEGEPDDSDKADEMQDRLDELDPQGTHPADDQDPVDELDDHLDDLEPGDPSDSDEPDDLSELDPPDDSDDGPTGTVEFFDGDVSLGTADIDTPMLTVSDLTSGDHTITAIYGGDDVYTSSESDPLTVTVQVPPVEIPDQIPDDAGDLTITPGEVEPGGTVEVSGSGFEPNEEVLVALYSDPVTLTTTTADDDGQLVVEVTIPDDTEPGDHEVLAHAASSSLAGPLTVLETSDTTEVQDTTPSATATNPSAAPTNRVVPGTRAGSSKSGPLAMTGSGPIAVLVTVAFGFLVTGGLVRQLGRRRFAGHGRRG